MNSYQKNIKYLSEVLLKGMCFFLSISISFSLRVLSQPTDRQSFGLKGEVKDIKIESFEASERNGHLIRTGIPLFTDNKYISYSRTGNMITEIEFYGDRKKRNQTIYTYNNKGQKERYDIFTFPDSVLLKTCKLKYDSLGRMEKEFCFSKKDSVKEIYFSYYDSLYKFRKWEKQLKGHKKNMIGFYTYNEKGYRVLTSNKDLFTKHFNHSLGRRKMDSTFISRNNEFWSVETYNYNKHGDVISDVEKVNTSLYKRGNGGLRTLTYTYKYDKNNNWIKCIHYYDGRIYRVTIRYLTYY